MPDIVTAERLAEIEDVARKCKCLHCKQAADLCATVRKLERELAARAAARREGGGE